MDEKIVEYINNLDEKTYICMGKVIFGHEIWLENASVKDGIFSADLAYGHNMKQDGIAPDRYINPIVFDSDGNAIEYTIEKTETKRTISFKGTGRMPYTMYVESIPVIWNVINDGTWKAGFKRDFTNIKSSASYQMYSKMIFSKETPSRMEHATLDILPCFSTVRVDDLASFEISYEGKPLTKKEVKFYCRCTEEEFYSNTDDGGIATMKMSHPGEWMVLVRHKDSTKCIENEFDESVFIVTLVVKVEG